MIFYCTRCRLPLEATARPGQTLTVTCPACLELMTIQRPEPIPAIPLEGHADAPLGYRGLTGDVEIELQKDMQFAVWGIVAFGVMGVIGYWALRMGAGLPGRSIYWIGWIGGMTAFLALITLARHAKRGRQIRSGAAGVRTKTTGERVVKLIALGISGLLLVVLTIVAAIVLLLAACLVLMGGGAIR
jgi:hypothetical protein